MKSYNDLTVFSQVVGQWPPPVAAKWKLLMAEGQQTLPENGDLGCEDPARQPP
jgi:hypothetical protein